MLFTWKPINLIVVLGIAAPSVAGANLVAHWTLDGDDAAEVADADALDFEDAPTFQSGGGSSGYRLKTTPQDFARFGPWILQRGTFNSTQLIPSATVDSYLHVGVPGALPRTTIADTDYLGTGNTPEDFGGFMNTHLALLADSVVAPVDVPTSRWVCGILALSLIGVALARRGIP